MPALVSERRLSSASSSPWPPSCASPTRGDAQTAQQPLQQLRTDRRLLAQPALRAQLPVFPINRLAGLSAFVLARKP